ncbi:hypothetical protein BUALT_Bualt05G0046800 [Buddleja alternifolia]|uniref:NAB domain-containing protein n=1 Tax=Buddleja alternifolia TaxID=168488 RepID=A0AAV6XGH3_9LAMI|nr:hypothetical protein BUALT_Bualt05G0046800 [Buddleja alternifolia]
MTKHRLKGSMKTFENHIDPEKEEQLKWVKIEIENQVKKIVKLGKSINGNREGNLKKKSELIHLVEDFHQQYKSLYSLYEDLRGEVKNNINSGNDDNSSLLSSDSESYYSPKALSTPKHESYYSPKASSTPKNNETSSETPNVHSDPNQETEIDDLENTILKDKLTSSSEVKEMMNLSSQSPEFGVLLKDLTVQNDESDKMARTKELEGKVVSMKIEIETLCAQKRRLKEKVEYRSNEAIQMLEKISRLEARVLELEAKENEFESCIKKREDDEKGYLSRISDLATQASNLQLEVNKLRLQRNESEKHLSREAKKVDGLMKKVDNLKHELVSVNNQKGEYEMEIQKKSTEILDFRSQIEDLRNQERWIVEGNEGLKVQVKDLELQVHSLRSKKNELEEKITKVTQKADQSDVDKEELRGKISELEKSLSESEDEIKASRNELSAQIQSLEVKGKDLENALETLQNERNSLRAELESLWNDKKRPNWELEKEKQEFLQSKSQMEKKNAELSNNISDQKVELESLQNDKKRLNWKIEKEKQEFLQIKSQMEKKISDQILELEALQNEKRHNLRIEKENTELSNKISDQRKNLLESEAIISKLKYENEQAQIKFQDSKFKNFHIVEKRIEETAEEFRKQFEDKYRILSRRIRVAEQLHVENKEWYLKTRGTYEQENKELKERLDKSEFGFRNVKDITLTANDVLVSLDSVALKFEECTANFLNRISKSSCELKFAKDWAMRKNKALIHVKDDLDCLLSQLDDKEGEILVFREKVWKSENKVRELEKMIKEKDDLMVALKEEKREAIRQLCVWIDYHRSRSDYYKKILLPEMNPARRTTS